MAMIVKIEMGRESVAGIRISVSRDIVLWGKAACPESLEKIHNGLQEIKQLRDCGTPLAQSDMIRAVCDHFVPGCWEFASQAGSIVF